MKRSLGGGLPSWLSFESFPLWSLLAVCCLCIAGDAVFHSMVDFPLCSMVDFLLSGQSPMEIFPLSMWVIWVSVGCWAVCGWGRYSAGPPPSFLKWNLRHLLVTCRNLLVLPRSNCRRSWNELCRFAVWYLRLGSWNESNFYWPLSQAYPNLYLDCVQGLERSQPLSLLLSTASCTSWVLKWLLPMSFSPLTRIPLIWRVLKGVSISVAKSSVGCSSGSWSETTKLSSLYVRKGLELGYWRNSFCVLFAHFGMRVLKWGLERSQICILSVCLNCCCAQICRLAIYEGPCHRYCYFGEIWGFCFYSCNGLCYILHNTLMRPSLTLAGCPMMISLRPGVSTMKNSWSWNEPLL